MLREIFTVSLPLGFAGALLVFAGVPQQSSVEVLPINQYGELPSGGVAGLCVGYNELKRKWGATHGACPANHAYFGVDDPAGSVSSPEQVAVNGTCCPLPSADILKEEHSYSPEECPANTVATGTKIKGEITLLRCTAINSARYKLGVSTEARYWGDGAAGWQGSHRVEWANIPPAIRYANGRLNKNRWDVDGCVGYPWGSLLTKKSSKYCAGFGFRQLQFVGAEGDPSAGTPVRMYPECDEVQNVSDPQNVVCVKNTE